MEAEKKVIKSVRVLPSVFEKISDIAKESGMTDTGAALEAMVNAWEIQNAKGLVPERAADVADFDAHLQGIQKAFLRSLDLAQSAEAMAVTRYRVQLEAQADTIARLKTELDAERQARIKAEKKAADMEIAATEAAKEAEEAKSRDKLIELLNSVRDKLDAPTLEPVQATPTTPKKAAKKPTKKLSVTEISADSITREEHEIEPLPNQTTL